MSIQKYLDFWGKLKIVIYFIECQNVSYHELYCIFLPTFTQCDLNTEYKMFVCDVYTYYVLCALDVADYQPLTGQNLVAKFTWPPESL